MFLNKFFKEIIFFISSLLLLICQLLYIFFYNTSEASFIFFIELKYYYILENNSFSIFFLFITIYIIPYYLLFNFILNKYLTKQSYYLKNNTVLVYKSYPKYLQFILFNNKLNLIYFSTSVIKETVNINNIDFSNLNINISEFEVQNYTINDFNSKVFINYTVDEKINFCITEFTGHFIKNIGLINYKCYPISNSFLYITDAISEHYFLEILEFKHHFISLDNQELNIYTLSILTNVSFLNVDLKTNSFDIKIFYINFIISNFALELGEIYFSSGKYLKILHYFQNYFSETRNNDILISKIKENILSLKKSKLLDVIF